MNMETEINSDKEAAMHASLEFHDILNRIQSSSLNFQLQVTPFSAQILLKKTLQKDKAGAFLLPSCMPSIASEDIEKSVAKNSKLEQDIFDLTKKHEEIVETLKNSVSENKRLKEIISQRNTELECTTNESSILKSKLETAETEILKYFAETKEKDQKHSSEICGLKACIRENNELLANQKSTASEAYKSRKALEKNIHNLEKKNESLNNKMENLQASKNELRIERDKLAKQVKGIQKQSKPLKVTKSFSSQTEPEFNNNLQIRSISGPRLKTTESFNCFVCDEVFTEASQLRTHGYDKHEIELSLDNLLDFNEEDAFIRFLRSIKMESEYIATRRNLYPEHWDHVEDRMKFRMLAKRKLEMCSRLIEENLKKNEVNNLRLQMRRYNWAEI